MTKWQSIALAIVMVAIFGGMALESIFKQQSDIKKAASGLEECPQSLGSFRVIWVKDCLAYTKILNEQNND